MTVTFTSRLLAPAAPLKHAWEHTVGSGRALLALRADWREQLQRCHDELGFQHVRFHAILADEMGTLVSQQHEPLYSFFNADRIWDFLLSIGMRPFVELGFMPEVLASGRQTVFHYRGNVTPPADYEAWATLIRKLVGHWVERYGIAEVRRWFFEVWNEPNLPMFWTGTQDDYFTLYRHTAQAIKSIDGSLRVGGPATAMTAWIGELLDYCAPHRLPVDFISTHIYPTDPLGFEGLDTEEQLANSPRDLLRDRAKLVRELARERPVYFTEWNISSAQRDPHRDEPFAAAYAAKSAMETDPFVDGYSFWTFTDIFDELDFPSIPYHGGFGLLNLYGVPKPVYRAFQLLHGLGDERLPVEGRHETVDAWVVRNGGAITVLLTNHAQPRHAIMTQFVEIRLTDASAPLAVSIKRIDEGHANPRRRWREMGEPEYPSRSQVEQLEEASRLVEEPLDVVYEARTIRFDVDLPPHAVVAVTLALAPERSDAGGAA